MSFINLLIAVFIFAYLIRSLKAILGLVFLWQLKEYRLDRMLAHLKTPQGKRIIFNPFSLFKWFIFLGILLLFLLPSSYQSFFLSLLTVLFVIILPMIIFPLEAFWNLVQLVFRGWQIPKITIKSSLIIFFGLVILPILYLFFRNITWSFSEFLFFIIPLLVDRLLGFFVTVMVVIMTVPSVFYKKYLIKKAKKKLLNYPNLKVIGVTGSYGKTSTKEFLSGILATKFKVLKTQGSNNTTWGVVKTILNDLTDQEIFVCEMGAYKIGEIREICQICKPSIGVITGINEQHLDLFGSLEKTVRAKYELIQSLPENGLAVFNGGNEKCRELYEKTKKIGQISQIRLIGQDFKAEDVKVLRDKLEFKVLKGLKFQKMTAKLLGKQNIENLLLAMTVADYLGMGLDEMAKAVEKLGAPERTMRRLGISGTLGTLIDDTFNTNPDGVLAALEYMKLYSGKKILVLQPMIELGKYAKETHQKVGKLAAEVCDLIILTNKNYHREFKEKVWVGRGKKAAEKIRKILGRDGIAVFEGKESKKILDAILENDDD